MKIIIGLPFDLPISIFFFLKNHIEFQIFSPSSYIYDFSCDKVYIKNIHKWVFIYKSYMHATQK
jgi:hypothetical protein